jgi:hypothetical protein
MINFPAIVSIGASVTLFKSNHTPTAAMPAQRFQLHVSIVYGVALKDSKRDGHPDVIKRFDIAL